EGNMILHQGDIKTLLGDGTDLEDRIANYVNIIPALEGMKGTLDLRNYSSSDDTVIFRRED
ncbi:MAG: colicin transporter, partial [Lachnospiraceae bacterium]|nr:colicin transporter [Lachnospiraceae bacterium]